MRARRRFWLILAAVAFVVVVAVFWLLLPLRLA
jgi:hypothetical protein